MRRFRVVVALMAVATVLAGCGGDTAAPPPTPAPAPAPPPPPPPVRATEPEPSCDQPASRPVIQNGSVGEDVRALQAALELRDDGVFGPNTERAVRAFQRDNGLAADGIVGRRTWSALGLVCDDGSASSVAPATPPTSPAAPPPAPPAQQARSTDVVVTIGSATRSGSTISVSGTATVPDGAYVAYEVVPARGGTAFREGAARVQGERFSFSANVSTFPSGPVEVWVAFVTVLGGPTYDATQPASVLQLYGNLGQNITGPNVTPGPLRLVEAVRIVN